MVFDDDINTRKFAYNVIMKSRINSPELNSVREYIAPKFLLNDIENKKYFQIINWNDNITEPPFTRKMSIVEIGTLYESGEKPQSMDNGHI